MIDNPSFGGYSPLDHGEYRLLRVKDSGTLTFDFQKARIDEAVPPYFALSYTWGVPGLSRSISVNGLAFHVRQNLHEFCTTWASKLEKDSLIWIDAICIDQENKPERSAQVSIVHSIYGRATCVLCWLGPSTKNTSAAFARIKHIADRYAPVVRSRGRDVSDNVWSAIDKRDQTLLERDVTDPTSVAAWQGIDEILQCEYFVRTWIVQETVQENREKILLCGDLHIVWDALGLLDYILYAKSVSRRLSVPMSYTTMRAGALFNIRERLKNRKATAILDLLYSTNSFGCKNPRDKIYAIRSLAQDVGEDDLLPDYEKSLPEVYKEVAAFCIEQSVDYHHFDTLGFASNPPQQSIGHHPEQSMPSWVPDWRHAMDMYPFPTNRIYNPCLDRQAVVHASGNHLHIGGLSLDTVVHMSPMSSSEMIRDVKLDPEWFLVWDHHCMKRAQESSSETLERVVVADAFRSDETNRGYQIDWALARRAKEQPGHDYVEAYSSARSFIHTCKGRRLITTSRGYIGIAPGASQLGDKVCMFFGGQVLYVLREVDKDHHIFVGQAYVHGLMDGEGFSLFDQPMGSLEKFIII